MIDLSYYRYQVAKPLTTASAYSGVVYVNVRFGLLSEKVDDFYVLKEYLENLIVYC